MMLRGPIALLIALAVVMAALTGCGRKGPPEPPEGTTYPRQYPSPTYQ